MYLSLGAPLWSTLSVIRRLSLKRNIQMIQTLDEAEGSEATCDTTTAKSCQFAKLRVRQRRLDPSLLALSHYLLKSAYLFLKHPRRQVFRFRWLPG
jgi:hypothetical protein